MSDLYQLPDGWEWQQLKNLTDFENGDRGKNYPSKDSFVDKGIPVISATNLNGWSVDLSGLNFISEERYNMIGGGKIKKDDILFCLRGSLGKCGIINNLERGVIASSLVIVRPRSSLYTKYLLYYFNSSLINGYINQYNNGAAQPNLSAKNLSLFYVPLPLLEEQKRIVQKLDALFERIDKAIALLQKNIDAADNFMNSVLNDVFSILEQNYPMESLFKIADVNRGKSKHRPRNDKRLFGGNYPFIQTGDVRNASKYIISYSDTYSEFGLSQSKLWQKGTICMTIAANIGDVAILGMDSCFPDSVVGIFSETESNEYLYYYLLTLKKQLESKATTTAQMNINIKVLQDIELPLPNIDIQKRTVRYLDCISDKIEQVKSVQQQKLQSLLNLKSSILDQAFHGKL